jgi:hypothetical protein
MAIHPKIHWTRIGAESVAIVASILLAFAIDAWWDESRDRKDAKVLFTSLHGELVGIEEFIIWQDQFVAAINNSAKQLLTTAVGEGRELGEREIDRLLGDLIWFVSASWFAVPELESLIRTDELSLIENSELRHKLKSWFARNQFFKGGVERQARLVDESYIPYLEENASLQQIYNAGEQTPGHPEESVPAQRIELREMRSHSHLLDDPIFQNMLARRIGRMTTMVNLGDSEYMVELRELIGLIEQELAE